MGWVEKTEATVFDDLPMPGLWFLDGDMVVASSEFLGEMAGWERGKKYPLILFPHAETSLSADADNQPLVCIHRQMRLPYFSDRENAYQKAVELAESHQQVYRYGNNKLELWLDSPSESILVEYDNREGRMVDLRFIKHDKFEFPTLTTPRSRLSFKNIKLTAYLNLINAAEEQPFILTTEGLVVRGLLGAFVRAKIEAQERGLVPTEIQAAIQIGESRNPSKRNPPRGTADFAPYNTEAYWEQLYQEAEQFWLKRYRGEEE